LAAAFLRSLTNENARELISPARLEFWEVVVVVVLVVVGICKE
jgi:hypothetical protein